MVKCNKHTQHCNCHSNNTNISGGYSNGILTVTVGNSSGNILIPNYALKSGVITEYFSVNIGNSITLLNRIDTNLDAEIYFNGLLLNSTEYTIQGYTITFIENFIVSGNQEGNTEIIIKYYKK